MHVDAPRLAFDQKALGLGHREAETATEKRRVRQWNRAPEELPAGPCGPPLWECQTRAVRTRVWGSPHA